MVLPYIGNKQSKTESIPEYVLNSQDRMTKANEKARSKMKKICSETTAEF